MKKSCYIETLDARIFIIYKAHYSSFFINYFDFSNTSNLLAYLAKNSLWAPPANIYIFEVYATPRLNIIHIYIVRCYSSIVSVFVMKP
jgi:hypothetical protein